MSRMVSNFDSNSAIFCLCERFARSNSAIAFFSPPTASTGSKSFSSPSFNTIMLLDDE